MGCFLCRGLFLHKQVGRILYIIYCESFENMSMFFSSLMIAFSFLTVVKQKAALEKEAKVSILEAGVADVSTSVHFTFHFEIKGLDD